MKTTLITSNYCVLWYVIISIHGQKLADLKHVIPSYKHNNPVTICSYKNWLTVLSSFKDKNVSIPSKSTCIFQPVINFVSEFLGNVCSSDYCDYLLGLHILPNFVWPLLILFFQNLLASKTLKFLILIQVKIRRRNYSIRLSVRLIQLWVICSL